MFPFEIAYEIAEGGMFKSRAEGGGGLIVITDNQKLLFGSFFLHCSGIMTSLFFILYMQPLPQRL